MIGKSLGTLVAKVLVVTVTAAIVTGSLVAAGAFSPTGQTTSSADNAGVQGTVRADLDDRAATGTVTATAAISAASEDQPKATASPSPEAKESESSAEASDNGSDHAQDRNDHAQGKGDDVVNHGRCVSFAAQAADKLGLTGEAKGDFISAVARSDDAVSDTIPDGAKPDAACAAAILKAAKTAKSSAVTSSSVTATAVTEETHGASDVVSQGHGRGGHG